MLRISLAAARVNANLTQSEVAKALNVSNRTIIDWEKGRTEPKISEAYKLSSLYNVCIDNIFFGSESQLK